MEKKGNAPLSEEALWTVAGALLASEEENCRVRGGIKTQAVELIDLLRAAIWPQVFIFGKVIRESSRALVADRLAQAGALLADLIRDVDPDCAEAEISADTGRLAVGAAGAAGRAEAITAAFLESLPDIKALLQTDVQAAYEGDPAARSLQEIRLAYPAFEAISIYRLAHRLYELGVPLLPRVMTEHAHRLTGIDIHPGATIGAYFFIDHGTGVVIGETTTIGHYVKLYQGVTLGARSFEMDENGNPIKGIKRHPDIGNHVIIYSGATILGGDTVIGDGAVIGGNVWLTHSVAPGERVVQE